MGGYILENYSRMLASSQKIFKGINKMKDSKYKTILIALAFVLVLLMASVMLIPNAVKAQEEQHGGNPITGTWSTTIPAGETPAFTVSPLAFLSVSPNPIGVNQVLLVNMWLTFPSAENRYCAGYMVNITRPDGTTDQVGPLNSYVADGTAWFTYVVTQVGTWTFKFSFPGQWFPAGYYLNGELFNTSQPGSTLYPAIYYQPASSPDVTLTVQSEQVLSWYSALPTDYWTRPILPNNREWNVIAGNYPWSQQEIGGQWSVPDDYLGPFVSAPNTAHIVWKTKNGLSGIIGGETGVFSTLGSAGNGPSVIYMGRCYETKTVPINGVPTSSAVCYDLRTGELIYSIPISQNGYTPTHIAYWQGVDLAVPGAGEAATFGVEIITIASTGTGNATRWWLVKINPLTGANTSIPIDTFTYPEMMYRDGYFLSYNITGTRGTTNERGLLVNWTAQGSSSNFTSRIVSSRNITIPHSFRATSVSDLYGILGAYDPEVGITVIQSRFLYGNVYGYRLEAVSLITGEVLWNMTSSPDEMSSAYRPTNAWCRHGIYTAEMERGYWQAWDLQTGAELWRTEIPDYPWGEFWLYDRAAYADLLIGTGYTGVWAINETNGDIVWHYADPSIPFETPYSSNGTATYSIQDIEIADGKVYVTNNEHTPTQPATRGWGLICLNVTTGELMYKINGANLVARAASDGYLTATSTYSGYMYVLGKGKTAITLSAPQTTIAQGQSIVLTGTILDMSPAQPGTACVSKDSMATWMDYLHHQMPIDGQYHNITITGVPVSIDVFDSNGNYIHIATVTSDASGVYGYTWTTPSTTGQYQVIATFMGDDSYGSSYASTYLNVAQAPTPSPTPTGAAAAATASDIATSMAIGVIIILIAIAIVGALILRRH